MMPECTILQGDALAVLKTLPAESVHCCVTSPPYWGLRDYGVAGQLGLEKTPEEYVAKMVEVFREVRRVMRRDGTLWANMGDGFAANGASGLAVKGETSTLDGAANAAHISQRKTIPPGLKPKDLIGMPWRLAFALQSDGWWLRSEIIWAKRNCMPESVTDRPTKSHEQVFLLAKSQHYYYDAEAVKVPASDTYANDSRWDTGSTPTNCKDGYAAAMAQNPKMPHRVFDGERRGTVNLRDVWHLSSEPFKEAHFATFPQALVRPCILAGTSARGCCPKCGAGWERVMDHTPMVIDRSTRTHALGQTRSSGTMVEPAKSVTTGWRPGCECVVLEKGQVWWPAEFDPIPCTVLDPFFGSGTTGLVALELGRKCIGIELNPAYIALAEQRCNVTPGLPL